MTTNWTSILSNRKNRSAVTNFANGNMTGREFYATFANTSLGGHVRNLLRTYGVDRARKLARKALNRREFA
tara:strand:+ start:10698 stop:10910 length:213 start_codon:yes stop_codon:yes gene_type:complete